MTENLLTELVEGYRLRWKNDALCASMDPVLFFPDKGKNARAAKQVCRQCPVREQCLDYALETNQSFGVWGGFTEGERTKLSEKLRETA